VSERLFTVDEVNALIPKLEHLMTRMQRRGAELRRAIGEAIQLRGSGEGPISVSELLRLRPEVEPAAREMEELLREVEATGGQFKGLDLGLVDFPAEVDGEIVLLCWQFGEEEVDYYHSVEEGFARRKPLTSRQPRLLQ